MELYRSNFFQNFTPIPDDIFDPRCSLSSTEKLVYIIYLKHTDRNSGVAWPGNKRVAEMAQISIPSLKRISANLEVKGYISKEARFNEKGQQLTNLIIVHHPLETADFKEGIKNNTPPNSGEGIKFNTPKKQKGGITGKTPGGITHNTQTRTIMNKEEEAKPPEDEREIMPKEIIPIKLEAANATSFDEPEINPEPIVADKSFGNNNPRKEVFIPSPDQIEMVKKRLGIEHSLAFLLAARCQDKLDKVIAQLINAKKPIRSMTAYLLTLMAHPDKWELFMENVENEFLTKERPKKRNREDKPKRIEEEREIYIPPSARSGLMGRSMPILQKGE